MTHTNEDLMRRPDGCPTCSVTLPGTACFGCGTLQPADPPALQPRTITLTPEEVDVLRGIYTDAWAYRLGEATGEDDPELTEDDTEALAKMIRLSHTLGLLTW